MKRILLLLLVVLISASCMNRRKHYTAQNQPRDFDTKTMRTDLLPLKNVSGQVLYLPVYSNIPYQIDTGMFDMSAFVSIHNTDFNTRLILS